MKNQQASKKTFAASNSHSDADPLLFNWLSLSQYSTKILPIHAEFNKSRPRFVTTFEY